MVKVILDDKNVFVSYNGGERLYEPKNNMWLWLLGAIKDRKKSLSLMKERIYKNINRF